MRGIMASRYGTDATPVFSQLPDWPAIRHCVSRLRVTDVGERGGAASSPPPPLPPHTHLTSNQTMSFNLGTRLLSCMWDNGIFMELGATCGVSHRWPLGTSPPNSPFTVFAITHVYTLNPADQTALMACLVEAARCRSL